MSPSHPHTSIITTPHHQSRELDAGERRTLAALVTAARAAERVDAHVAAAATWELCRPYVVTQDGLEILAENIVRCQLRGLDNACAAFGAAISF